MAQAGPAAHLERRLQCGGVVVAAPKDQQALLALQLGCQLAHLAIQRQSLGSRWTASAGELTHTARLIRAGCLEQPQEPNCLPLEWSAHLADLVGQVSQPLDDGIPRLPLGDGVLAAQGQGRASGQSYMCWLPGRFCGMLAAARLTGGCKGCGGQIIECTDHKPWRQAAASTYVHR